MGRILAFAFIIFSASLIAISAYSCQPVSDIYITNFEVTPNPITEGETAILHWNVTGATTIKINNGIGDVSSYGNSEIKPGQTTEYILSANNRSMSIQKSVTLVVNPRPVSAAPQQIKLPVISATDTENLLSNKGKEVQVEGDATYVSSWLPDRFTGQGTTFPWTFMFFMQNIWEGFADNANPGGNCSPECWRDYTRFFRAIIKPEFLPDFYAYLPNGYFVKAQMPILRGGGAGSTQWNSSTGAPLSTAGFTVQKPYHILMQGTIEGYLSAPAIYLTNVNQIVTVKQ